MPLTRRPLKQQAYLRVETKHRTITCHFQGGQRLQQWRRGTRMGARPKGGAAMLAIPGAAAQKVYRVAEIGPPLHASALWHPVPVPRTQL